MTVNPNTAPLSEAALAELEGHVRVQNASFSTIDTPTLLRLLSIARSRAQDDTSKREGDWQSLASAPFACHVLAAYFDQGAGEWVYSVEMSPPKEPFVFWSPLLAPPGSRPLEAAPVDAKDLTGAIRVALHAAPDDQGLRLLAAKLIRKYPTLADEVKGYLRDAGPANILRSRVEAAPVDGGEAVKELAELLLSGTISYRGSSNHGSSVEISYENTERKQSIRLAELLAEMPDIAAALSQVAPDKGLVEALTAALKRAEYQPGDHPVVPVKIAAFMDEVRAALASREGK